MTVSRRENLPTFYQKDHFGQTWAGKGGDEAMLAVLSGLQRDCVALLSSNVSRRGLKKLGRTQS